MFCNHKKVLKENNNKSFGNFKGYFLLFNLLAFLLISVDQLTKYLINKPFLEDFYIYIYPVINRGSSFGIFSDVQYYNILIIVLSIVVLIFLIIYYREIVQDKISLLVYTFAFSGIVGNLIDRLVFGYVRDFIGLKYLFVFNLADFYLNMALLLFLYCSYVTHKKQNFKKTAVE